MDVRDRGDRWPEHCCPSCGESVVGPAEHHVERCLQRFRRSPKQTTADNGPCVCVVCRRDITHLDSSQRTAHVNRCLDGESEEPLQEPVVSTPSRNGLFLLMDCPLCDRSFKTPEACKSHVKQCSVKLGVSPKQVVEAIRLQQRYVQERMAAGLPLVRGRRHGGARPVAAKKTRPLASIPKSKFQEDVQMARALSASLTTATTDREDAQRRFHQLLTGGHHAGKRKKIGAKETPVLLTRTEEERAKKTEEKIAHLLTQRVNGLELGELSWCVKLRAVAGTSSRLKELASKEALLWDLASQCEESSEAFYVCALCETVTPSQVVPVGSRLLSLTQLPGRRISRTGDEISPVHLAHNTGAPGADTQAQQQMLLSALNCTLPPTVPRVEDACGEECPDDLEMGQGFLTQRDPDGKPSGEEQPPVLRRLSKDLDSLVGSRRFCDLKVITRGAQVIPAHRVILLTRCPALEKDMSRQADRTPLLDWTSRSKACVTAFLRYLYAGVLELDDRDSELLLELRGLAFRYDLTDLSEELKGLQPEGEGEEEDPDSSLADILATLWEGELPSAMSGDPSDGEDALDTVYEFVASQRSRGDASQQETVETLQDMQLGLNSPCSGKASCAPAALHIPNTATAPERTALCQASPVKSLNLRTSYTAIMPVASSPIQSGDDQHWTNVYRRESPSRESPEFSPPRDAGVTHTESRDENGSSPDLFGESRSSTDDSDKMEEDIADHPRSGTEDEDSENGEAVWDSVWDGFDNDGQEIASDIAVPSPVGVKTGDSFSYSDDESVSGEERPAEEKDLGEDHLFLRAESVKAPGTAATSVGQERRHQAVPSTPVTPLPDYGAMRTPELAGHLNQFGVRRFPRKQAVNILHHIYEQTHPLVAGTPERSPSALSQKENDVTNARRKPSRWSSQPTGAPEEESAAGVCSISSSDEDHDSHGAEGSDPTLELKKFLGNGQLYEKVLAYKPTDFQKLREDVRRAGIRISAKDLMDFLDEQCVTFTVPRPEKQRRRQANFRARVQTRGGSHWAPRPCQ